MKTTDFSKLKKASMTKEDCTTKTASIMRTEPRAYGPIRPLKITREKQNALLINITNLWQNKLIKLYVTK